MTRKSHLRTGAAALQWLLLAGIAVPFAALPSQAPAQITAGPQQLASWQGVWAFNQDGNPDWRLYYEFVQSGGKLVGVMWKSGAGGKSDIDSMTIDPAQSSAEKLVGTTTAGKETTVHTFTMSPDRSYVKMVSRRPYSAAGSYLRRVTKVGDALTPTDAAAVRAALLKPWVTPHGVLKIAPEGNQIIGRITRPGGTTVLHTMMSRSIRPSATQDWYGGLSPYNETDFQIELAPDYRSFVAYARARGGTIGGLNYWEATLEETASAPASQPPAPAPAPQPSPGPIPPSAPAPAPLPAEPDNGPVQFQTWEGVYRATGGQDMWIDVDTNGGASRGILWETRNGSLRTAGVFDPDLAKSTAGKLVGTFAPGEAGIFPAEVTRTADRSGLLIRYAVPKDGGTIKASMFFRRVSQVGDSADRLTMRQVEARLKGRWKTPFGDLLIEGHNAGDPNHDLLSGKVFRADGTTVRYLLDLHHYQGGAGAEAAAWYWNTPTSKSSRGGLKIAVSPDGAMLAAWDTGDEPLAGVRDWTATKVTAAAAPAPPPAPTPPPAPQPSPPPPPPPPPPPAPVVQPPAPAPSPPPVARPPAPVPGTVAVGAFHQLERFDVRVDEVRAARDGKVHLFLTAANKSGAARSIGQGTFTAVMTDADGVGILSETAWRATGDEPRTFDVPPMVPPGGEVKVRFVLQPSVVHAPLARIGLRETAKKVLYFDASAGDPGMAAGTAPPTGGGAFKSLSKLDVRIDRAAPARDGRLEVFITFRNPSRDPQSVTAAAQRLSGINSDGSAVTARYALYSVRGERGENDALPVPIYVEAGGEARVRYVFDDAPAGALTITDGQLTQTFTPGG